MVKRPKEIGAFEFSVTSSLRAAQLIRGCVALVALQGQKLTTTAQLEVADFKVRGTIHKPPVAAETHVQDDGKRD